MNIQTVLSGITPYNDQSYETFAEVMKNAYIELSFWGQRNVYAVGYEGSISLVDLAQKITDLVDSHPEFSQEERKLGFAIQGKVWSLLNISEHQQERATLITLFFLSIREMFDEFLNERISDVMLFKYATAKQYKELTGKSPKKENDEDGFFCKRKGALQKIPVWLLPVDFRGNLWE